MKKNTSLKLPEALTKNQKRYLHAIQTKEMVIATGPAGTGKSYLAAAMAAYYYSRGEIKTIILTRPTVPVSRSIGFMPGDLLEKMQPWVMPFLSVLIDHLGKGAVDCMIKNGGIKILPFEVIRGHTFHDAFVILDEAQNSTIEEIKAFVTRIGENSKTVVNGDLEQSDLRDYTKSGLYYLQHLLGHIAVEDLSQQVPVVEFDVEDIVRSGLCKLWVKAFRYE